MTAPRKPKKVYSSEIVSEDAVAIIRRPPARTTEGRERQLTAKAYDLAEKQIDDGSASSQVITHFLKLGTEREKLERQKLALESKLLSAKVEGMASMARTEEMYSKALSAMRAYAGQDPEEDPDD
jgi:hypothetical protein